MSARAGNKYLPVRSTTSPDPMGGRSFDSFSSPPPPVYEPKKPYPHGSSSPPPPPPPPIKTKVDYWAWEWLALMTSFLAIAASTVLLVLFDNKTIPDWSWRSGGISVNTILSLLSTLSRASLLVPIDEILGQLMWLQFSAGEQRLADVQYFNEASRGPMGAAMLFWRQRGKTIAAWGSLLMVASMGIGPAQQQLLSYPTRLVVTPKALSHVPRAEQYNDFQNTTSISGGASEPVITFGMLSGLYTAILGSEGLNSNAPAFACDTGNCDFPRFTSLAICSECHDVSNKVQSTCADNSCSASYGGLSSTTWKNPSAEYLSTILNITSISAENSSVLSHLSSSSAALITALASLQPSGSAFPPTYTATECALYWCANTYNVTIVSGVYHEEILSVAKDSKKDTLTSSIVLQDPSNPESKFLISNSAQAAVSSTGPGGVGAKLTGWSKATGAAHFFSSDIMQGLSAHSNITAAFEKLSVGLTNSVRSSTASPNTTPLLINGQTWIRESFIRIRWAWLLWPICLWVFSAAFLVIVVVKAGAENKKSGVRAWGANTLALLVYGLDERVRERIGNGQWEEVQENAENVKVKLVRGHDGIRLRVANGV